MFEMDLDAQRLIETVTGRVIVGGEVDAGACGLHLKLDDGRYIVFTGMFVVAVIDIGKTLQ